MSQNILKLFIILLSGLTFLPQAVWGVKTAVHKEVTSIASTPRFTGPMNYTEHVIIEDEEDNPLFTFKGIFAMSETSRGELLFIQHDRIIRSSAQGKPLGDISRIGEGPCEFKFPLNIWINSQGHLFITDNMQIIRLNPDFGCVATYKIGKTFLSPAYMDERENIFGVVYRVNDQGIFQELVRFDSRMKQSQEIASFPDNTMKIVRGKKIKGGVMGGMRHEYSAALLLAPPYSGFFVYAHNMEYKLHYMDLQGNGQKILFKPLPPQLCTPRELACFDERYGKHFRKTISFNNIRPVLHRILTDSDNRLHVILRKPLSEEGREVEADVFDGQGEYLYNVHYPDLPLCFGKNCFYSVRANPRPGIAFSVHKYDLRFPEK